MAESAESRRNRYEQEKKKKAADPEFAAKKRAQEKAAKKRYEARKKLKRDSIGKVGNGKPGRIVALCGWSGW